MNKTSEYFGDIDIYLFDQILKNRFTPEMKILDAGCGGGRNSVWFLREGFEVFGIDRSAEAVAYMQNLARELNPALLRENFRVAAVEDIPFAAESFDVVISSAVLHFAENEDHFNRMLLEMSRVLKPSGIFFARLASSIGIENLIEKIDGQRYFLPDGSERFLVDERMLIAATENFGATFVEPIKTTNVQNLRCMTTWVIRKNAA